MTKDIYISYKTQTCHDNYENMETDGAAEQITFTNITTHCCIPLQYQLKEKSSLDTNCHSSE